MTADVHPVHPADCVPCRDFPANRACLSHSCPDCGSIVWGEHNELGEAIHECPEDQSV